MVSARSFPNGTTTLTRVPSPGLDWILTDPTHRLSPFLEPNQAKVASPGELYPLCGEVEPDSIVLNVHPYRVIFQAQADDHLICLGVPGDVIERLLVNAE